MHLRPPSLCELEVSLQGVKLIMSLEDEYDLPEEVRERNGRKDAHTRTYLCMCKVNEKQTD